MLDYSLQKEAGKFKPSPPGLDLDNIVEAKRKNRLFK